MNINTNIILFFILYSATVFAQKNIVKLGFIGSRGVNTGIQYERSVSPMISIAAQFGYATITDLYYLESANGIGLYLEGRYYFLKNKDLMEGLHAGVYMNYLNTKSSSDFINISETSLSGGIAGGYQWVSNSHITIDSLLGLGYMLDAEYSSEGWYPLIGINLGYNF